MVKPVRVESVDLALAGVFLRPVRRPTKSDKGRASFFLTASDMCSRLILRQV